MKDYLDVDGRQLDALVSQRIVGHTVLGEAMAWSCPEGWFVNEPGQDFGSMQPVYVDEHSEMWRCDVHKPEEIKSYQEAIEAAKADGLDDMVRSYEQSIADLDQKYLFGYYYLGLEVVPNWSTDMNSAWGLADTVGNRFPGWHWRSLMRTPAEGGAWTFRAWFRHDSDYDRAVDGEGATAESALCRALLRLADLVGEAKPELDARQVS